MERKCKVKCEKYIIEIIFVDWINIWFIVIVLINEEFIIRSKFIVKYMNIIVCGSYLFSFFNLSDYDWINELGIDGIIY